ncbi:GatB/YqeY domain-containing protein [Neoconidiobolus thromboides FSU 785]|nr:GatB/YqeY domain-containing protein [Neoconidiobolus thromboides FSU 785]
MVRLFQYTIKSINTLPTLLRTSLRHYSDAKPSLLVQLKTDMKSAMRNKERGKLGVIKSVLSDIGYAEKSVMPFKVINSDAEVASIIQKGIKKRMDSIEQYKVGNREDLVQSELEEVEVLKKYLPEQLEDAEILIEIKKTVEELGVTSGKQIGLVLKSIKLDPTMAAKARVAILAKEFLKSLEK